MPKPRETDTHDTSNDEDEWDSLDQAGWESFPASDSPAVGHIFGLGRSPPSRSAAAARTSPRPAQVQGSARTRRQVDEIWGRVAEIFADREFLVELTDASCENDGYDEYERVISESGSVELGDYVHVWVLDRDDDGTLYGRVVVEDGDVDEDAAAGEFE